MRLLTGCRYQHIHQSLLVTSTTVILHFTEHNTYWQILLVNSLTYDIIGTLKAAAIKASCSHVSWGPTYTETFLVHKSAVFWTLIISSPYVSATINSNLWPLSANGPLLTSSTAKDMAPEIVSPGRGYSRSPARN